MLELYQGLNFRLVQIESIADCISYGTQNLKFPLGNVVKSKCWVPGLFIFSTMF